MRVDRKLTWYIVMSLFVLMACNNRREKPVDSLKTRLDEDSLVQVQAKDRLRRTSLHNRLVGYFQLLDVPSIEGSPSESYRVLVEFSWGKSPVGSHLVIGAVRNDNGGVLAVKSLRIQDGNENLGSKEQISAADFQRIADVFERADFEQQPIAEEVDYVVHDASRYIVEQVKSGQYHAISRSSAVDPFIYQVLIELLNASAAPNGDLIREFERLSKINN